MTVPTGLDLLNALAALAVALLVCWLLLLDFEYHIGRARMIKFLIRRLAEERGTWPTIPQRVRIALAVSTPFFGGRYLRARLRRYANHPGYRDEWRAP
jgi:hypothetical protein